MGLTSLPPWPIIASRGRYNNMSLTTCVLLGESQLGPVALAKAAPVPAFSVFSLQVPIPGTSSMLQAAFREEMEDLADFAVDGL